MINDLKNLVYTLDKLDGSCYNLNKEKLKQGDVRNLEIHVFEGGEELNLGSYNCLVKWVNANGTLNPLVGENVSTSGNVVHVELNDNCTKSAGTAKWELVISKGTKVDFSYTREVEILPSVEMLNGTSENLIDIWEQTTKAEQAANDFIKKYGSLNGLKEKVDELNNTKASNTKVEDLQQQVDELNNAKITKNAGSVTMADIAQDVKEAMTGGSVAVVGKNSVLTNNIVDKQITPPKTSFLKSLNLFNGNYLHGYYLIGRSDESMYLNKNNDYYLIVLPINSNCQYSINNPEDIGKEDGNYWFKVATSTKTFEELTELLKVTGTVELDGAVKHTNTETYTKNYKLTTGANDKTLLINISKYKTPYVEVLDGIYDKALYKSYSQGWKPYGINIYSKDEVDELIGKKVSISKVNDNEFNINIGKYTTNLKHIVDSGRNSDLWNLLGIYCGDETIVNAGTDIIGPIQELGASDFSGGVHGHEKNVMLMITCDGVTWDKETTKTANEIKIIMESEIYRVSNKSHIYNRYVEITISHNKIRIRNNYVCVVNDSVIFRATNGGLIAIPNSHLTALTLCNYISSIAPVDGGEKYKSKNNISATMFWNNGSIEMRNITGKERKSYEGYLTTFDNESPVRNKIYFDVIKANPNGTQIQNGENILGEFEYIFN